MITLTHHDPDTMTVEDRRKEIARILAAGYQRLLAKKAENCLEDLDRESAHVNKTASDKEAA